MAYVAVASALGIAAESRLGVDVAIVVAVIAALAFQPMRRRLQRAADRTVYGERPTRYEAVAEFGSEMGDDPDELLVRLANTLHSALRLEWVSVRVDDAAATAGNSATAVAL